MASLATANFGDILANIKTMVKDNLKMKKRVIGMERKKGDRAETASSFTNSNNVYKQWNGRDKESFKKARNGCFVKYNQQQCKRIK